MECQNNDDWNEHESMSQDPDPNRAAVRKTAIIDNELYKHKFDIAALQETQLAGSGTICKTQEEPRLNGSGFAVALLILSLIHI